jgi:hypothetical protein
MPRVRGGRFIRAMLGELGGQRTVAVVVGRVLANVSCGLVMKSLGLCAVGLTGSGWIGAVVVKASRRDTRRWLQGW